MQIVIEQYYPKAVTQACQVSYTLVWRHVPIESDYGACNVAYMLPLITDHPQRESIAQQPLLSRSNAKRNHQHQPKELSQRTPPIA